MIKDCSAFLSKVKRKSVNNSGSNYFSVSVRLVYFLHL